jgi:hypothetical protein
MAIDGALALIAAAAALAGLVRGYTGFGAAMVFVPVASIFHGPAAAVAWIFLIDLPPTVPLVVASLRRADLRAILWLSVGATIAIPIGVHLLAHLPEAIVRLAIAVTILAALVPIAAGWRYRGRAGPKTSLAVGGASGLLGGLASLYGPPVILFWLSGHSEAERVRANVMVYFGITTTASGIALWANHLFTREVMIAALVLAPIYAIAIGFGARAFRVLPERLFRPAAFGLIGLAAVATLPVW